MRLTCLGVRLAVRAAQAQVRQLVADRAVLAKEKTELLLELEREQESLTNNLQREMARVRAARAAAGSPGAVRHRSRSGAQSPVRSVAAGHGARDSMFALQQDVTASLGSAGRARSQSHSPPARSRPRSPSPPAPSAARRGRTPASEIRWSSRHSAVEQSEPVQDSYARFPADVGVVTGSGREGWVYREQRAESPQRVTLRLKPSGSRQRARARGMGR